MTYHGFFPDTICPYNSGKGLILFAGVSSVKNTPLLDIPSLCPLELSGSLRILANRRGLDTGIHRRGEEKCS